MLGLVERDDVGREVDVVVVCVLPLPPSRAHRGAHDTCIIICIQEIHTNMHAAGALPDGRVGVLVPRGAAPVLAPRVRAGHVAPHPKRHACTLAMGVSGLCHST